VRYDRLSPDGRGGRLERTNVEVTLVLGFDGVHTLSDAVAAAEGKLLVVRDGLITGVQVYRVDAGGRRQ